MKFNSECFASNVSFSRVAAGAVSFLLGVVGLNGCEKNGECNNDSDCYAGKSCTLVGGEGKCVQIDKGTSDVSSAPVCTKDSDCAPATPLCLSVSGVAQCVECGESADCAAERPKCSNYICSAESTVVTCFKQEDCPSTEPICFLPPKTLSGTCVECNKASDCPGEAPACVTGKCKDLAAP